MAHIKFNPIDYIDEIGTDILNSELEERGKSPVNGGLTSIETLAIFEMLRGDEQRLIDHLKDLIPERTGRIL